MGAAKTYAERYTIATWEHWKDQWELIDGMPYNMSPVPSIRHQDINGKLYASLLAGLRTQQCRDCKVMLPIDWEIAEDTVVQPDLLVICKPFLGKRLTVLPSAVFEILSPSTQIKDRTVKFELYQSQRVPYYTLVDPDTEKVEIYSLGEDGSYSQAESGPEFTYSFNGCRVSIDFSQIWEE
jgi:Uma2 family endonuclease